MSTASTVPERFKCWIDAEDDEAGVASYRRAFAAIWLLYDVIDLVWGMTERSRIWFPHPRSPGLLALQSVLIASGVMLLAGRRVWEFGMIAAAARAIEALTFFPLNDFFFASVVYLLLAHAEGGPFARGKRPKWVRQALVVQLAFIYVATGVLKLNPDWLGGGHLFVRTQYLARSHGWPYPLFVEKALASLSVDAWLAKLGVAAELTLGTVLLAGRPYWLAAMLVIGIHTFGAATTNVWFFSASMVAGVLLLLRRRPEATL
jgi:hypothetical protein